MLCLLLTYLLSYSLEFMDLSYTYVLICSFYFILLWWLGGFPSLNYVKDLPLITKDVMSNIKNKMIWWLFHCLPCGFFI